LPTIWRLLCKCGLRFFPPNTAQKLRSVVPWQPQAGDFLVGRAITRHVGAKHMRGLGMRNRNSTVIVQRAYSICIELGLSGTLTISPTHTSRIFVSHRTYYDYCVTHFTRIFRDSSSSQTTFSAITLPRIFTRSNTFYDPSSA
jgi:hypothetical protein